jgi:putative ABC transport system permease protein
MINMMGQRDKLQVIGVLKNFNYQGLRSDIQPLSLLLYNNTGFLTVRIKAGNPKMALAEIQKIWKETVPWLPFDYRFLDDRFNETFQKEERLGTIFSIFTMLAIIVACLGLFGLAAYTSEQRTKEIGIRKAMGASTLNILNMLNIEFTRFVLIAFILSIPVSWYLMNRWLEAFAYKTSIGIWPFLLSGFIAILIAWTTVSYQSLRAAKSNPVESLKNE